MGRQPGRRGRLGGRAVSPVLGTVLVVTIVVVLAAVVATMALSFQSALPDPAPAGGFDHDYVPTGAGNAGDRPYVNVTHQVGETADASNILVKDDAGNTVTWADVWTAGSEVHAGEYVHIDGFGSDSALRPICEAGQTYRVVYVADDGGTRSVNEWTVPEPPALPPGSSSDSDGDGIPDWC